MSKTMVEQVTAAVRKAREMSLCSLCDSHYRRSIRCSCEEIARAAIEAMKEPTFDPETVSYHEGMTRTDWWRSMIDAALATPAPERT